MQVRIDIDTQTLVTVDRDDSHGGYPVKVWINHEICLSISDLAAHLLCKKIIETIPPYLRQHISGLIVGDDATTG